MRVAVIGAGPIGLEMGLAAREAGHDVVVYEQGRVGEHVARWDHVTLFTPWSMNTTERGRAAVHDDSLDAEVCPTGEAFRTRYLEPLGRTLDVRENTTVRSISRPWKRKGDELGNSSRLKAPFQLLVENGTETIEQADAVIDCTGVFGDPAPLGNGGAPVPGERHNPRVSYGPIPVDELAGQRVLLVGDGASAVTVLRDLLAHDVQISWITPGETVPGFVSPPDDPLPQRRELVRIAVDALDTVQHLPGAAIARLDGGEVTLDDGTTFEVDRIIACTGFRPDHQLSRELQVHLCWGSEGPMKLAGALLAAKGDGPADCLAGGAEGPELLQSPEPNFFILGNKSYGRRSDFLLGVGHRQVDEVLTLLR